MVISLVEVEMKVKDTLKKITRDTKNPLKNHYDQIRGFLWILLITGEAKEALREWAGIDSQTELITVLMTKHVVPARKRETETDIFKIGALYFHFPYMEILTLAQQIATDLTKTLIAGTYSKKNVCIIISYLQRQDYKSRDEV